ncbi:hypothetical protein GW17_00029082 [Ensete ventricosum]|uniref:Uncharacterized protein n=1 Tax=Ensete ventricosum TaxID=4639 RepID=A0A426YQB2_ENSVE|nr:hypothetical protein B296_00027761 [Ensete ventricosum]RWW07534.1 hypothetical protein GW17_00029082 [Ensete ventricosum]
MFISGVLYLDYVAILLSRILVGCSFSGEIPHEIGSLSLLTFLDMSNNSFDESDVPSWFSTLPSLTSL